MSEIRDYLDAINRLNAEHGRGPAHWIYRGPPDLLLRHGRSFPERSPDEVPLGLPGHCFHNAYALAKRSKGRYRYVEGYATGIIPVHHAWVIDAEDRVVDPTWDPDLGHEYFGLVIPLPLLARIRRKNSLISALWNYTDKEELLLKVPYDELLARFDKMTPPVASLGRKEGA